MTIDNHPSDNLHQFSRGLYSIRLQCHHQMTHFEHIMSSCTTTGVGIVYGNKVEACRCFELALKDKGSGHQETNNIDNSTTMLEVAQLNLWKG